jgi:hypothetical protein
VTKYKSVAPFPFQTPFFEGEVLPGQVRDLPDTQPDGSELVWPAEFWQPVDQPAVTPTPENESSQ